MDDADRRRFEHHREPLSPGPAKHALGWLPLATDRRTRPSWWPWLLSGFVAATIGLGTWGFRTLALAHRLSLLQSVYHAARLYTFEIGPADGSGTPGVNPNWQILLALALAAALGLGVLLAFAGGVLRRLVTRRLLSEHVIVCGAGVHGSHLARELSANHDVVLVDPDAGAPGMRSRPSRHEWRMAADAVDPDTLALAGARRASWLVAVTGDDYTNSQIVSALQTLEGLQEGLQAIVQIEDPALARFLEDGERPEQPRTVSGEGAASPTPAGAAHPVEGQDPAARVLVTAFSPNAIAADALLDRAQRRHPDGEPVPLLELGAGLAPYLIVAGDHPLLDAIVLAALRHWRVRTLRLLENGQPSEALPPMRIGLYGPQASARVERLTRMWHPEPDVLELEARDAELAGSVPIAQADWLTERGHAAHAFVACTRELDAVELSLGLSRALGPEVLMTRVSTQPASLLDKRIQERTAGNRRYAQSTVQPIDELAYDRDAMARVAAPERLAQALRDGKHDERAQAAAAKLFNQPALGLQSDPMWRVRASEATLAHPLIAPVPISALLDAGLSIELRTAANLRSAAEALSSDGRSLDAFTAWCEYARLLTQASPDGEPQAAPNPSGEEPAEQLLRLRALTLRAAPAAPTRRTPPAAPTPEPSPALLRGATRAAIFIGACARITVQGDKLLTDMLGRALAGYDGVILSRGGEQGLPGLVGSQARKLGLVAIAYVPSGHGKSELHPSPRETAGASELSVREPLAMWSDLLAASFRAGDVRVVACPGEPLTRAEILLARALGAPVAWIDPASETLMTLDDELPFGVGPVLELPDDAMTLRAFLHWSATPAGMPTKLQEDIARYLHADYRRRQRARKPPGDAALAPWEQLLPALRHSNLAQAGDIPNKLAAIGKRLAEPGTPGVPLELSKQQVEELAEIEHGRWNVERLLGGWQLGERDVSRRVSSYLKPWVDLDEPAREYDREAVRNIAPALAEAGWQVADVQR